MKTEFVVQPKLEMGSGDNYYTTIVRYALDSGEIFVLKVKIRQNSYAFQSWGKCWNLATDGKWHLLTEGVWSQMRSSKNPYPTSNRTHQERKLVQSRMDLDSDDLLEEGITILRATLPCCEVKSA